MDLKIHIPHVRGGFRGAQAARTPSIFCRDKAPDFVWVPQHRILNKYLEFCAPQAKRMHQIVRIDFENYNFSQLLRGYILLRHPISPQAPKFCQSLIWAPPLLKNPGSTPACSTISKIFHKECMGFKWNQWRSHWGGKGGQSASPDS